MQRSVTKCITVKLWEVTLLETDQEQGSSVRLTAGLSDIFEYQSAERKRKVLTKLLSKIKEKNDISKMPARKS
jgi:hypothetical protein